MSLTSAKVLARAIIYQPGDLRKRILQYNLKYRELKEEGIPSRLDLNQSVMNGPAGKSFIVLSVWAPPDIEEGQKWLARISSWNLVVMGTVTAQSFAAFNVITASMVPKNAYGSIFSLGLHQLTPEVLDVMIEHATLQPDNPEVMSGIHELRAESPKPSLDNVFSIGSRILLSRLSRWLPRPRNSRRPSHGVRNSLQP